MYKPTLKKRSQSSLRAVSGVPSTLANTADDAAEKLKGVAAKLPSSRRQRGSGVSSARNDALASQLAGLRTEIADEKAELSRTVGSLNEAVTASRKSGARGRSRTFLGLLIGAGLMYHFDPEQGRERRANTAQLLNAASARVINRAVDGDEV